MYWTRADNVWGLAPWLVMCTLWWAGGILIGIGLFRLPTRERVICGLGTGLLLFISLSNLVSYLAPFPMVLWTGAGLTLAIGLLAAWRAGLLKPPTGMVSARGNRGERFGPSQLEGTPKTQTGSPRTWGRVGQTLALLLILAGLTLFFGEINRGLAIFDDYHNLPLISVMAAGDVPPHYYLNTANMMAYHYGWHLFAASLVRIGNLFPWSAFDISKAFSMALLAVLAWLWFLRWTRSQAGAALGALLAVLGGGTRWLLLFVSPERLAHISAGLTLQGTSAQSGPDLVSNLIRPWLIEGDGPIPFPFAFANGIFPPGVMALGGSGAIPLATLFLLLLLAQRRWSFGSAAIYSLILASLGLTAEYLFIPLAAGLGLVLFLQMFLHRKNANKYRRMANSFAGNSPVLGVNWQFAPTCAILASSILLAFGQGGLLTEMLRRVLARLGGGPAADGSGFIGFALRWPPEIVSAHLGPLSLLNPGQILVALAEVGPLLFLAPWVTWWAWKQGKRGNLLLAGMGAAALAGFLAPMFVQYIGRDRDITHMSGSALFLWMTLAYPLAWHAARRDVPQDGRWANLFEPLASLLIAKGQSVRHGFRWGRWGLRMMLGGIYAVTLFGGVILLAIQMLAIPSPQLTTFVDERDAALASLYWNRLEPGAQILDAVPHRAVTLFGLGGGRAYQDFFMPLPEWKALLNDPDPAAMAKAGYSYLYYDLEWWNGLPLEQRDRFKSACVRQVNQGTKKGDRMRRLLDIHACR